jgi:hypothetical protein
MNFRRLDPDPAQGGQNLPPKIRKIKKSVLRGLVTKIFDQNIINFFICKNVVYLVIKYLDPDLDL